jgi:hypothetical protein
LIPEQAAFTIIAAAGLLSACSSGSGSIGSQPDATVTTRSCPADRISVGGEPQGRLWDRKGAAEVKRLMHIKISHSTSSTG